MNAPKPQLGESFDARLELQDLVGVGRTGSVYKGVERRTGNLVAVKVIDPGVMRKPELLERFRREAEILRRLEHPSIVQLISSGAQTDTPYLVLEWVAGTTLDELLVEHALTETRIPRTRAMAILRAMAGALEHAHIRGIVHRDLSPQNVIILDRDPWVKILDFGLGKLKVGSEGATTRGRTVGSLFHSAPEQVMGDEVGPPADVFALAVLAFEMVTSRRPFAWSRSGEPLLVSDPIAATPENAPAAAMDRLVRQARPRVSTIHPELGSVDAIIALGLAIAPQERPGPTLFVERLIEAWPPESESPTLAGGPKARTGTWIDGPPVEPTGVAGPVEETQVPTVARDPSEPILATQVSTAVTIPGDRPNPTVERTRVDRLTGEATRLARMPGRRVGLIGAVVASASIAALAVGTVVGRPPEAPIAPAVEPPAIHVGAAAAKRKPTPELVPERQPELVPERPPEVVPERPPSPEPQQTPEKFPTRPKPLVKVTPEPKGQPAPVGAPIREKARIQKLLSEARKDPTSDRLRALDAAIRAALEPVTDPKARATVERLSRQSVSMGDLEGMESAVDALYRALEPP